MHVKAGLQSAPSTLKAHFFIGNGLRSRALPPAAAIEVEHRTGESYLKTPHQSLINLSEIPYLGDSVGRAVG